MDAPFVNVPLEPHPHPPPPQPLAPLPTLVTKVKLRECPILACEDDYPTWSATVLHNLEVMGCDAAISDQVTLITPEQERAATLYIRGVAPIPLLARLRTLASARATWEFLRERYAPTNVAREIALQHELDNLRQGATESVGDYCDRAQALWDKLIGAGSETRQHTVCVKLLSRLLPSFRTQAEYFIFSNEILTLSSVRQRLVEAARLDVLRDQPSSDSTALAARPSGSGRGTRPRKQKGAGSGRVTPAPSAGAPEEPCPLCKGRDGRSLHTNAKCWKQHPELATPEWRARQLAKQAGEGSSDKELMAVTYSTYFTTLVPTQQDDEVRPQPATSHEASPLRLTHQASTRGLASRQRKSPQQHHHWPTLRVRLLSHWTLPPLSDT